jgi:CheY-like chemotaxis protein/anti-sigma regulatory factor (Ser/Thr protein kinase)
VVDDVLDYAKLESGSFLVDIKPTKLQHTLDSVVHSISQKVQEKNIRLRTHYSPTLPEILETDSRRLQQVLFNLLGNAGKFSHNNSVIDLTVSVVKSELNPGCEIIRFAVKDYGKGIDAKDFETIFQPFSQASKETQNVYGGTGLGLSITSKLVNRLGGTIAVDSEPEKYAQFTVDLPMNGEPVDVKRISNSLAGILIILVEPKRQYDYSFTSFPIKDEPHPLCPAVADVYGLHVIRCHTLAEAYSHLSKKSGVEQTDLVLLVHEQLYHNTLHESLNALIGESNYTLMTHGPNYLVERTKNCHFKNLSGIFPVTLLDSIACHVQNQKMKNQSNITDYPNNVSCAATSNNLFSALSKPAIDQSISQLSIPTITPPSAIGSTDKSNSVVCNKKCPNTDLSAQISSLSSQTPLSPSLAAGKKASPKLHIKVLYAEDNIVNQKVLSRVLNRTGITDITVVDDGKKAVDVSAREKFDCIFMDMQMPVMDGMEATKIIMARDPNAKVIFVTAHALDEFKSKAESVGAASFISKPFRVSDIEKVLQVIGLTSRSEYTKTNEDEKLEELKQNAHPQVLVLKSEYVDKHEDTSQNKSIAMPPPPPVPLTPSPFVTDRKEAVPQRHLKVLYAEDNLINQKVLSRVLNRSGIFDITIVDNGKKAVDICATTNFDCIFMDYEMPIMDGMEATKIIMEHDRGAKVIFVTAHVLEEYKNKAMSLGATDFLAKPVRICDIEAVLQRLGL